MHLKSLAHSLSIAAFACLCSCATTETIPRVAVQPNDSGIEVGTIQSHRPGWLIGMGGDVNGKPRDPDIPARTVIQVKRTRSIPYKGGYFIRPSGALQVASIEHLSDYDKRAIESLGRWRDLLSSPHPLGDQEQRMLYQTQLSEIPWMNAGRCFHGKLRKRTFPWGDAVLFLTSYVQGSTGGPVSNDMLVLVVQGVTKDGRYAVNARFEIHHPKLPDSTWDERSKGRAVFSINDECQNAERWLDGQPDDAFSPTFEQYELFLNSLEISPGPSIKMVSKAALTPHSP
ncbi:hypothetical protein [Roseimicrobium sp. ORNL1]|uniref:hypothetical protein n=1 Tax=Roseimicrobium sp. ORNL1 TaxID=2711231 RepID=UPI0013E130D9|nr:hypothetical protein [Roseimicrobium sp. ORNL1]QIF00823.1 hypothetical protein G5S37_04550 [Roseimicrobium sp. ORNL1]